MNNRRPLDFSLSWPFLALTVALQSPLPSPTLGGEAVDPQEAQLDPFSCWVWCAFSLLCSQHTVIMTVKILTIVTKFTEWQLCPRYYARLCT